MLIGTMQGRLLPKYKGRYQAFPLPNWPDEFPLAASMGLNLIEFILDYEDVEANPLMSAEGLKQIAGLSAETGVAVHTVCADYFMEAPLHHAGPRVAEESRGILERLIANVASLGVKDVVIPCVDQSSLRDAADTDRFVAALSRVMPLAERNDMHLALETDLAPQPFTDLLKRLNSETVTVNYDTGNSAALGYDPVEELAAYGDRITDIHIKD
ncbi:MAG: TIM barrel protein, partial [Acidobacteriota bacterium]|nr:TIM barrel protein [Acidobacteriota bacterium]